MSNPDIARHTLVLISFAGVDITDSIEKYLKSFSYTDNEDGSSDDLQITLHDRDGLWMEHWLAEAIEGAATAQLKIQATIRTCNWSGDGVDVDLPCGEFELDEVEASGPPSEVVIKATSLPFSASVRQTMKSRAWENYHLSGIANQIAWENGMGCYFESARDPEYEREEQTYTSDIAFLYNLCSDAAINLKATGTDLILFDQIKYESQAPVFTIKKGMKYTDYQLMSSSGERQYTSCRVSYVDPDTGELIEGIAKTDDFLSDEAKEQLEAERKAKEEAEKAAEKAQKEMEEAAAGKTKREKTPEELAEEAQKAAEEAAEKAEEEAKEARLKAQEIAQQRLEIYEKVSTAEEALALAEKRLRYANKFGKTASFTFPGMPILCAGVTVDLEGWGSWDGRYFCYQAKHTVSGGYTTQVSLRKVLEGY